jgi:hypothetical protein
VSEANLNIEDGARRTALFVSGRLSGVTYEPETADVVIRLAGKKSSEIARCLVREQPDPIATVNRDLESMLQSVAQLHTVVLRRTERVERLQHIANKLTVRVPRQRPTTQWWR